MCPRPTLALALLALACSDPRPAADADDLPIVRGGTASATASTVLRVVEWNIASARDSSIDAIAARLTELDGDVLVLLEVDSKTQRAHGIDQPSYLANALELEYAYVPIIPWDGGRYGIATMSRYPLSKLRRIRLSNAFAGEERAALDITLRVADSCLRVISHHADVELPAAVQSTREVLQDIEPSLGSGLALIGDLNQVPSDDGPRALQAAGLIDLGPKFGDKPTELDRRIDYVFTDTALLPCVSSMTTYPEDESDHNSLAVDFDLSCLRSLASASDCVSDDSAAAN